MISTPLIEHYTLEGNCFFNGSEVTEPSPAIVLPPSEVGFFLLSYLLSLFDGEYAAGA